MAQQFLDKTGLELLVEKIKGLHTESLNLIGTVPAKVGDVDTADIVAYVNAKTAEAAAEASGDNSALDTRVTAAETAITTLNGTGTGSVSKAIDDLRKEIMEGEGVDPDVVESFKELQAYIVAHGSEAATMAGNITSLQTGKQDVITDLETIRSNAATGAGLKTKVDGIAEGAQVNVIEAVMKNGVALTVTDKAVDITIASTDITDFATAVAAVKSGTATEADHAAEADKDGDGNVISTTYLKVADIEAIPDTDINKLFE